MDLEGWIIAVLALLGAACIAVVIWAAMSGDAGCPKGQTDGIVTYMPVTVGTITTVQPVYGCVDNG